ncbi:MAG: trypsin-like peptidase domain-containing protein [Verrucomicrobiota bacterium]|jgi:S1-C subfamily serine protease|nr:trypsin-like peptidase domain-containing protein [Verrucomicrobiota bacterium]
MNLRLVVLGASLFLAGAIRAQQTDLTKTEPLDVRRDATVEAIERVMPSVVNVEGSADVDPNSADDRLMAEFFGWRLQQVQEAVVSRGSGVVIDEEGYVLTNVHVVDGVKRVFVKFNDGSEPIEAERVALNAGKDVALLRLKAPGRKFPAVKFAKDDDLLLGETVIALGNPFGYAGSVSRGILSSRARRGPNEDRSRGDLDTLDWIQTDAAINPGNSGGPLINLRGDLIGINVATLRPQMGAQGIGFAIPIKRVNQALAEVLSGESVGRFWFGARLKAATRPLTIQAVQPGSPAEKAGLKPGDVISAVQGDPPSGIIEFNRALVKAGDASDIPLTIRRAGTLKELRLRLIEESDFFNNEYLSARAGFKVAAVRGGGFVVQSVDANGPAAAAGLKRGHLIRGLDRTEFPDVVTLARYLFGRPKGETVEVGVLVDQRSALGVYRQAGIATLKLR